MGFPLSFSVVIESLVNTSFAPPASLNHRRLRSIGLFCRLVRPIARNEACLTLIDASDDQMIKMRLIGGRNGKAKIHNWEDVAHKFTERRGGSRSRLRERARSSGIVPESLIRKQEKRFRRKK